MNSLYVYLLLVLSAVAWIACILINLTIVLHYSRRKEGFIQDLFLRSLRFDYVGVVDRMSERDKRLYILTFVGIIILFFPTGYFLGSLFHQFINS